MFTLSNMNISETNGSIATKFYLNHHWGGRKAIQMARGLKFRIKKVEGLYHLCSENKGADQLRVFVFSYAKRLFSHDAAYLSVKHTMLTLLPGLRHPLVSTPCLYRAVVFAVSHSTLFVYFQAMDTFRPPPQLGRYFSHSMQ